MAKNSAAERIIMGIDPGTTVTGYGIIRCSGNKMELVNYGIIDMRRAGSDHYIKLKRIFERTLSLIEAYLPDELAIEAPFYGKNVQSMLKLGRAQGVAMAAALYRDIPIREYAPKKIKMSITGNGNASKEQVSAMLEKLLQFKFDAEKKVSLDASDGLAVAVCHFFQKGNTGSGGGNKKNYGSWSSFISDNPGRVK